MFTLRDGMLLVLLPLLFAAAASAFTWRRRGKVGWPLVLVLAGAVLVAGVSAFVPKGMPKESMDWLVLLPALALVGGIIAEWSWAWLAIAVVAIVGMVEGHVIAMHLAEGSVPVAATVLIALMPGVLYVGLLPLVKRGDGVSFFVACLMVAIGTVVVEFAGTFIQFGQYTVVLPAAMGGAFLARLVLRTPNLSKGSLAAFVLVWTSLITFGYLWADVTAGRSAGLAVAPLAMWVGEIFPKLSPRWRGVIRVAAVAGILAIVVVPAMIDLLKLMRSQTQVGGY